MKQFILILLGLALVLGTVGAAASSSIGKSADKEKVSQTTKDSLEEFSEKLTFYPDGVTLPNGDTRWYKTIQLEDKSQLESFLADIGTYVEVNNAGKKYIVTKTCIYKIIAKK